MLEWLDEQLVPVLEGQPTLLAIDLFSGHRTEEVLDTFAAHDITSNVIPEGCTGLVQPLDVLVNRPFKDILKASHGPFSLTKKGEGSYLSFFSFFSFLPDRRR